MLMETIEVGLFMGSENMPVEDYIFEYDANDLSIEDQLNFDNLERGVHDALMNNFEFTFRKSIVNLPNQADYTDIPCYVGEQDLVVYVNGPAPAVVALINWCRKYGQRLTLMHYNSKTGSYFPQEVSF